MTIATMNQATRRQKVMERMLRGYTNQEDIASALGVSVKTIVWDMQAIRETWVYEQEQEDYNRSLWHTRIRQLEYLYQQAMNGWEASKQTQKEVGVLTVLCPTCKGMAVREGEPLCRTCNGDLTVKEITRKKRGQIGDPAFLALARDYMRELSKLQNLYPDRRIKVTAAVDHQHQHSGTIEVNHNELLEVDADTLLKIRALLDQSKKPQPVIIEGKLADASKAARNTDDG